MKIWVSQLPDDLENHKVTTKVKHNTDTEATPPRIESHDSQLRVHSHISIHIRGHFEISRLIRNGQETSRKHYESHLLTLANQVLSWKYSIFLRYQGFNSPYYTETHKQLRKLAREFCDNEIMPYCHDWDEQKEIPREVYLKMAESGLMPLCLGKPWPTEYAGPCPLGFEPDVFHELVFQDEISRCGSGGFMWGIAGGMAIGLPPVLKWGKPALKSRIVPDICKGTLLFCHLIWIAMNV